MADNIETISYINIGDGLEHPIVDLNAFDNVEYNSQTLAHTYTMDNKKGDQLVSFFYIVQVSFVLSPSTLITSPEE
jgi:hypothetical protein